jgi:SpoVK/Ycf46/Vps4 family AAA+-type ATPase
MMSSENLQEKYLIFKKMFIHRTARLSRDAAMAPMREQLRAANVFGGMEARRAALQQSDLIIRKCHFDIAMQNIMPTVSQSEVRKYVQWMEEFGSK